MISTAASVKRTDIDVHGSGLVARAMALALVQAGFRVGVSTAQAPVAPSADIRAFAITPSSMGLLHGLGVWPEHDACPVLAMQVHDGASRLRFTAQEQGVGALAHILEPSGLEAALNDALLAHERVVWRPAQFEWTDAVSELQVVCEGGGSGVRQLVGVANEVWDYGQRAISMRMRLDQAHGQWARQWFSGGEVLALLPLGASQADNLVSVVWSVSAARATQLMALGPLALVEQIKLALGSDAAGVGEMHVCSERQGWPLAAARAAQFSGVHGLRAWVLAGDAAHRVHPLAGLGLNLGLGDVACLVRVLSQTKGAQHWRKVSDPKLLREFARERQANAQATLAVTDGLFQLVRWRDTPRAAGIQLLRRAGLSGLQNTPPIKRWLAGQAMR